MRRHLTRRKSTVHAQIGDYKLGTKSGFTIHIAIHISFSKIHHKNALELVRNRRKVEVPLLSSTCDEPTSTASFSFVQPRNSEPSPPFSSSRFLVSRSTATSSNRCRNLPRNLREPSQTPRDFLIAGHQSQGFQEQIRYRLDSKGQRLHSCC